MLDIKGIKERLALMRRCDTMGTSQFTGKEVEALLEEVERLRKGLSAKDGNIESEGESK